MALKDSLRRFFSWDSRQPPRTHEEAREREVFDGTVGSGQFGSGDLGYRASR